MYILTRYVVREVLILFLAALVGLTLLFTVGMGFKEGLSRGATPMVMLRIMPFLLPEMLGITIPVAMLYAVSGVFGRMTGTNEIVALKSLGISPMAVVWPVVVLAAFLSLGTVWMYEISATWGKPGLDRIVCESIEEIVYGVLRKERSCDKDSISITVKRVEGRVLIQPTIVVKRRPGQPQVTITAAEAELHTDSKAGQLRMLCRNGEIDIEGQVPMRMSFSGEQQYSMPLPQSAPDRFHRDWISMRDIPTAIVELEQENDIRRRDRRMMQKLLEANRVLGVLDSHEGPETLGEKIDDNEFKIRRLKTEPFRRWSNGFTCLCFTLIGIPVAMLWRHADVLTNFFVCFLPILAVYYPLLMLGEDLTTSGTLPPIAFWMGNVIIVLPAVVLLRWIDRH